MPVCVPFDSFVFAFLKDGDLSTLKKQKNQIEVLGSWHDVASLSILLVVDKRVMDIEMKIRMRACMTVRLSVQLSLL